MSARWLFADSRSWPLPMAAFPSTGRYVGPGSGNPGARNGVVAQAAMSYSWMMPPSTSRRVIAPLVAGVAGRGNGWSRSSDRCGLAPLVVEVGRDDGFEMTPGEDE